MSIKPRLKKEIKDFFLFLKVAVGSRGLIPVGHGPIKSKVKSNPRKHPARQITGSFISSAVLCVEK